MKVDLAGQVAFVTGAARGIGEAIARAMAANGAADIDAALAATLARFGRLDILVNNAGVNTLAHHVHFDTFPIEEWDRIVDIDLRGTFLVSRTLARPMLERGQGRIINIASIVGLAPLRLQSPFVAAKAGVIHLTKSMALEFGRAAFWSTPSRPAPRSPRARGSCSTARTAASPRRWRTCPPTSRSASSSRRAACLHRVPCARRWTCTSRCSRAPR